MSTREAPGPAASRADPPATRGEPPLEPAPGSESGHGRLRQLAKSPLGRYGLAVLSTAVALLIQFALGPLIHPTPFLLFVSAVVLSGWWGGGGPGLLAVGLSMLAVDYFFLPPVRSFSLETGPAVSLTLFALVGAVITRVNVSLRRTNAERARLLERERLARREAEAEWGRLQDLFMHAPAQIALFRGPEHVYILSNPLNNASLGQRQVLGKPVREALPELVDQGIITLLDRVYTTGEPFMGHEHSVTIAGPDGTEREFFLNFVYQPTRDGQGRIDGVASFAFDVTSSVRARQQAEALARELQRGEERYRTFVSKSTEGIYRIDPTPPIPVSLPKEEQIQRMFRDSRIVECNDAMARMYGIDSAAELQGTRLDHVLVPEDPRNTEFLRAFIQSGYRIENAESREVARDGTPRAFLNNMVGIVQDGLLLGAWGTQRDVTQQRRAEEELRRAEANSRFLSEASAALASSLDYESTLRNVARLAVPTLADWCLVDLVQPDGTLQRMETVSSSPEDAGLLQEVRQLGMAQQVDLRSPAAQALMSGRSVLLSNVTPELIRQSARSEEHAQLMLRIGVLSFILVPLVVRGRALGLLSFFTSHSGRSYTDGDLELLEDLARRAALSVENARLYRDAQEAIRLRDEFLSIASHELKTPLTPLSLKLHMLARTARQQPDSPFRKAVEDYITVGSRQVKKLSELVSDLLDVARIGGGRLRLELEEMELGALVREVVARHEPEAARSGSTLVLEGQASVSGRWDRLRLEQVITNLVDNAIKYGAGKPIRLWLEADAGRAILRVKDEGIGIAPESLSRIFERFERAVSDRHYGGLGLGLYITRTIVEAMGGTIQVESTLGQGATFTVVLPRSPREAAPPPSAS
ncbi:ATP-binding protein [Hyalangium gracile]|uniref:ATP-binding protein n=1 Tax=Hyalangium gracile TaxID=394092 RepID=UPI001CCDF159|nr:ATP-binding protein [Hyalangium gracile]